MSSLFPPGWKKLDPVECRTLTRSLSIRPWWWFGNVSRASRLNQCGGGETGLRDGSSAFDGRSESHMHQKESNPLTKN